VKIDSYNDAGVLVAADLVNELAIERSRGRRVSEIEPMPAIARVLTFDPPSLAQLRKKDVPGFVALAQQLREIFVELRDGGLDAAASGLNALLAAYPANPVLAKEQGVWRLHHHPLDAALVPMCASICAEAIARMIGAGHAERFRTCDADDCERVFFDTSKNASRRFCSTPCQNRTKTAAFRRRQARAG
jgi:predicted RNA-binding Zn ribbon-like protein